MTPTRFEAITGHYARLRLAVIGDFCLDRYLEIDPAREETSLETGLAVHNVVKVRAQPGAAGTILNNLVALGVGEILPVGFRGDDGEGYELEAALRKLRGVRLDHFMTAPDRRTFTYCKPLLVSPGAPPRELNRLDSKNWSPTPARWQEALIASVRALAGQVDGLLLMDQVDTPETGVVTGALLGAVGELAHERPNLFMIADSRRSLRAYPPVCLKMNGAELAAMSGVNALDSAEAIGGEALRLAQGRGRPVFVTLAERGILGASPEGGICHSPSLPVRGPIDIVGAGDAVTANLAAALTSGAALEEALQLANAAASVVVHQLGTTGAASVPEIAALLEWNPPPAGGLTGAGRPV